MEQAKPAFQLFLPTSFAFDDLEAAYVTSFVSVLSLDV